MRTILVTDEGFMALPGVVSVTHAEPEKPQALEGLLDDLELECSVGGASLGEDGETMEPFLQCQVQRGEESYWLSLLKAAPQVGRAELVPAKTASTSREAPLLHYQPQLQYATSPPLPIERTRMLIEAIKAGYPSSANVRIVDENEYTFELDVSALRGVVVPQRQLWEVLTMNAAVVGEPGKRQLYLVVDGSYAPGLGARPPARSRYTTMTGKYDRELDLHLGELMSRIGRTLTDGARP